MRLLYSTLCLFIFLNSTLLSFSYFEGSYDILYLNNTSTSTFSNAKSSPNTSSALGKITSLPAHLQSLHTLYFQGKNHIQYWQSNYSSIEQISPIGYKVIILKDIEKIDFISKQAINKFIQIAKQMGTIILAIIKDGTQIEHITPFVTIDYSLLEENEGFVYDTSVVDLIDTQYTQISKHLIEERNCYPFHTKFEQKKIVFTDYDRWSNNDLPFADNIHIEHQNTSKQDWYARISSLPLQDKNNDTSLISCSTLSILNQDLDLTLYPHNIYLGQEGSINSKRTTLIQDEQIEFLSIQTYVYKKDSQKEFLYLVVNGTNEKRLQKTFLYQILLKYDPSAANQCRSIILSQQEIQGWSNRICTGIVPLKHMENRLMMFIPVQHESKYLIYPVWLATFHEKGITPSFITEEFLENEGIIPIFPLSTDLDIPCYEIDAHINLTRQDTNIDHKNETIPVETIKLCFESKIELDSNPNISKDIGLFAAETGFFEAEFDLNTLLTENEITTPYYLENAQNAPFHSIITYCLNPLKELDLSTESTYLTTDITTINILNEKAILPSEIVSSEDIFTYQDLLLTPSGHLFLSRIYRELDERKSFLSDSDITGYSGSIICYDFDYLTYNEQSNIFENTSKLTKAWQWDLYESFQSTKSISFEKSRGVQVDPSIYDIDWHRPKFMSNFLTYFQPEKEWIGIQIQPNSEINNTFFTFWFTPSVDDFDISKSFMEDYDFYQKQTDTIRPGTRLSQPNPINPGRRELHYFRRKPENESFLAHPNYPQNFNNKFSRNIPLTIGTWKADSKKNIDLASTYNPSISEDKVIHSGIREGFYPLKYISTSPGDCSSMIQLLDKNTAVYENYPNDDTPRSSDPYIVKSISLQIPAPYKGIHHNIKDLFLNNLFGTNSLALSSPSDHGVSIQNIFHQDLHLQSSRVGYPSWFIHVPSKFNRKWKFPMYVKSDNLSRLHFVYDAGWERVFIVNHFSEICWCSPRIENFYHLEILCKPSEDMIWLSVFTKKQDRIKLQLFKYDINAETAMQEPRILELDQKHQHFITLTSDGTDYYLCSEINKISIYHLNNFSLKSTVNFNDDHLTLIGIQSLEDKYCILVFLDIMTNEKYLLIKSLKELESYSMNSELLDIKRESVLILPCP